MKILREIFGRIWAAWALFAFLVTLFIVMIFYIPCYLVKERNAANWHRYVSRIWMRVYLTLIACPLKVKGAEYFKKGQNYIVVCNHNSLMDVPVTTPFMPNANKTIAKKSFALIPFFGWIYSLGSVLVDRKSERSRRKSYDDMKTILRIGLDMVIYPEGTRNRTDDPLKSFHDGAFKLAVETGKPVIPTILFNTKKVLPPNKSFFLLPHKIEMHFLPALDSNNKTSKELREKAFRLMWDYYEANY